MAPAPADTRSAPRAEHERGRGDAHVPAAGPLRILVCPHELVTGGSQLIAIDLAARLRDRGHVVAVYAPRGPLEERLRERGLTWHPAPRFRGDSLHPAAVARFLRELRAFEPDIVHTYESGPALVAGVAAAALPLRHIESVLSMWVPPHVPDGVPLLVGTVAIARQVAPRRGPVLLMEPPVDTVADAPGDRVAARERLGVDAGAFVVSVVGRLSREHGKARGVIEAIGELDRLGDPAPGARPVLLVAGAGDEEGAVREAAGRARIDVRMLGDVPDPRDVYDAADVAFGMGASALRALAHARPVIVQGEGGFWRLVEPASAAGFLQHGFFGAGAAGQGLGALVAALAADPDRRRDLGGYGRMLVAERFSAERAVDRLEDLYMSEAAVPAARRPREALRALVRYGRLRAALAAPAAQRAWRRRRGRDV